MQRFSFIQTWCFKGIVNPLYSKIWSLGPTKESSPTSSGHKYLNISPSLCIVASYCGTFKEFTFNFRYYCIVLMFCYSIYMRLYNTIHIMWKIDFINTSDMSTFQNKLYSYGLLKEMIRKLWKQFFIWENTTVDIFRSIYTNYKTNWLNSDSDWIMNYNNLIYTDSIFII